MEEMLIQHLIKNQEQEEVELEELEEIKQLAMEELEEQVLQIVFQIHLLLTQAAEVVEVLVQVLDDPLQVVVVLEDLKLI